MSAFLVSYRPLALTVRGRAAALKFNIPRFVDSSCRREPDLQSVLPSISAICRRKQFAPRLSVGDDVLYITVKSAFSDSEPAHWRAVAHLRVIERFESHEEAAAWYLAAGHPLPSNCMVSGNPPIPYDQTNGRNEIAFRKFDDTTKLRLWDGTYRKISRHLGVFLVCAPVWRELEKPPRIMAADFHDVFGRVRGTRTPPEIKIAELMALRKKAEARGP